MSVSFPCFPVNFDGQELEKLKEGTNWRPSFWYKFPHRCAPAAVHSHAAPVHELPSAVPRRRRRRRRKLESLVAAEVHRGARRRKRERRRVRTASRRRGHPFPPRDVHELQGRSKVAFSSGKSRWRVLSFEQRECSILVLTK